MSVYYTYIMTLTVWTSQGETSIIRVTYGNDTWFRINKPLNESAVIIKITEERANEIIKKENLMQRPIV